MRKLPLLLALCLAGCAPAPMSVVPAAPAPEASSSEAVATPAPARPHAPSGDLVGRAETAGGPFAGAAVSVVALGGQEVVATAITGPDGAFGLELPEAVPAGALLHVTARKEGLALAALVAAPAKRAVQAEESLVLTEATSLATLLLGKRLEAAGLASRGGDGQVLPPAAQRALEAYDAFVQACVRALETPGSDETREEVRRATAAGEMPAELGEKLSGALATSFLEAADALGEAVLEGYRLGGTWPGGDMLGPVSLGRHQVSRVSLPSTGGGSSSAPTTAGGGTLVVTPGEVVHEGAEGSALSD